MTWSPLLICLETCTLLDDVFDKLSRPASGLSPSRTFLRSKSRVCHRQLQFIFGNFKEVIRNRFVRPACDRSLIFAKKMVPARFLPTNRGAVAVVILLFSRKSFSCVDKIFSSADSLLHFTTRQLSLVFRRESLSLECPFRDQFLAVWTRFAKVTSWFGSDLFWSWACLKAEQVFNFIFHTFGHDAYRVLGDHKRVFAVVWSRPKCKIAESLSLIEAVCGSILSSACCCRDLMLVVHNATGYERLWFN